MTKNSNTINDDNWDLVIKPSRSLFDINLKDLWRYRDLIALFVRRDFIAQYKQTVLGPLWHLIQPAFTTIMFMLVFDKIAGIPTDGIPSVLFYMSGITIWNYFSACLTGTSNTFISNASIFGKVYFPRLVSPVSVVISNMIRFGIQFLLLLAVIVWYVVVKDFSFNITPSILLIFPLILIMAGLGLGLGIIISSLTTKYRDFTVLVGFGVQLLMYASPVVYSLSFIKDKSYAFLVYYNPLSSLIELFRFALFGTGAFLIYFFVYSVLFMLFSLLVGFVMFNKVERSFMDTV